MIFNEAGFWTLGFHSYVYLFKYDKPRNENMTNTFIVLEYDELLDF